VDERLREHRSDLLYCVQRQAGGAAFVYLLFEHKSDPDEFTQLQTLRYLTQIWETVAKPQAGKLPPIIVVVFYHGNRPWRAPRNFHALTALAGAEELKRYVPEFEYHLCDLSQYTDEELKARRACALGCLCSNISFAANCSSTCLTF
jgi:hypothetical protein